MFCVFAKYGFGSGVWRSGIAWRFFRSIEKKSFAVSQNVVILQLSERNGAFRANANQTGKQMTSKTKQNIFVTAWLAVFFVFVALFINAANVDAQRFNECAKTAEHVEACI